MAQLCWQKRFQDSSTARGIVAADDAHVGLQGKKKSEDQKKKSDSEKKEA